MLQILTPPANKHGEQSQHVNWGMNLVAVWGLVHLNVGVHVGLRQHSGLQAHTTFIISLTIWGADLYVL